MCIIDSLQLWILGSYGVVSLGTSHVTFYGYINIFTVIHLWEDDSKLDLGQQVVRELQHSRNGVTVMTEDGCVFQANYMILSVSIGVLQSNLIAFNPPLPVRLFFCSYRFNEMI